MRLSWLFVVVFGLMATCFCPAARCADWQANEEAGQKAYDCGRFAEAVKCYIAALRQAEKFGTRDPRYIMDLDSLALAYQGLAKYDLAGPLFKKAKVIAEDLFGPNDSRTAEILADLGQFYRARGMSQEAEPLLKRALAI